MSPNTADKGVEEKNSSDGNNSTAVEEKRDPDSPNQVNSTTTTEETFRPGRYGWGR